ncbi:transporter substrate-binding domain-containing protein [Arsukibacterium sp. UBA3155]|uniref:transporter substrate-binding domain-containing protein n=1 Tax=Arsukibacterium sp. UBA3155 TaxID=1946058 RepID=UPI0025BA78BE|nr:transporter substrate-binding domain-containing protein [Arsukibacterium sp. UBA3155]
MLPALLWAKPLTLRGGVVQSFPGITVVEGNIQPEAAYGHAEIINCIESALNVDIEWQNLPTDRLLKLTRENELDLIYPMGFTAERDSYLKSSVWLTKDDDYFVYKTGVVAEEVLQQGQAKNQTIGVKRGSPQLNYLQSNNYLYIHQVYDYQQLLPLLKMNRVEMLAVPQPLAEELQSEMQADATEHNLQLYNYYTRDAGFYLSPEFADANLPRVNKAVIECRQYAKQATAIKQKS